MTISWGHRWTSIAPKMATISLLTRQGVIHVVPLVFTNALTVVEVASDQTTNLYFPDPPPGPPGIMEQLLS